MAIRTVGPTSTYSSIAAAMPFAEPNDTIQLQVGYSNETATVTQTGLTITGAASSTGIVLNLATGVPTVTLAGTAPINLHDASDGNAIVGNAGDNVITVSGGADSVDGGAGIDRLVVDYRMATGGVTGNSTSNFAEAGGGGRLVTVTDGTIEHFTIFTGAGADTITTGAGDDIINTGEGASTVNAGQGSNTIIGGSGADTFTALDGGNFIDAGNGANILTSGAGSDIIVSGTGADTIVAGGGIDLITMRGGADTVDSGAGNDRVVVDYASFTTAVTGGITGGTLASGYVGHIADTIGSSVDFQGTESFTISTGSGNDSIISGGGSDILSGGAGNDILNGGAGIDTMIGGTGRDVFYIDNAADRVVEAAGTANGSDTIFSSVSYGLAADAAIEGMATTSKNGTTAINLSGNGFANLIGGNAGANILNGAGGNDVVSGNAGNDRLFGGLGNDTLLGGAGNDLFFFDSGANASTNHDTIADFSNSAGNNDTIYLENAVFTALATGGLGGGFAANASGVATQADDHIIYNTSTGDLFYDTNGSAAGGSTLFATLTNHPTITVDDFVVI